MILLTAFRWLGLKGSVLALCALVAIAWGGWQRYTSASLARALALSQASVAVLEAQRDAANAIAADYQTRAEAAVAAEQAERAARQAEAQARAKKWERIRKDERDWAETPVPEEVWRGLGK